MTGPADNASDYEPSRATPAFVTGGGGFAFEDLVGAWLVSGILAGQRPVPVLDVPRLVAFQEKTGQTALDDVVVHAGTGRSAARWFASIKSFDMLRGADLAEFAASAWSQLLAPGFDRDRDFVGLICGRTTAARWQSLQKLIQYARNDTPERLDERIAVPGIFDDTDRALWAALRCPDALRSAAPPEVAAAAMPSPGHLLSRLQPLHLDLLAPGSHAEQQARDWCAKALSPGHAVDADRLFESVQALVARARPTGGSIDWGRLADELSPRFALARRPDAGPDWELLDRHTTERLAAVRDTLAGVKLPRAEARQAITDAGTPVLRYLSGPSGCGKTALAKAWLEQSPGDRLWLSARDVRDGLLELGHRLRLRLPVVDAVLLGQRPVRVVIDGLDRVFDGDAPAAVAALGRAAQASAGGLEMVVTCQAASLERVTSMVLAAGATGHDVINLGDLDDADITALLQARPNLRSLVYQAHVHTVLRRPKLLQVVADALPRSTAQDLETAVRDEAGVADLWWDKLALGTTQRPVRGELLRGLARWTADHLTDALPAGDLATAGLGNYVGIVETLRSEEILGADDESYTFSHDLFGDWVRYGVVAATADPERLITEKEGLPTWHRAIRLHALKLLRDGGPDAWFEQHDRLRQAGYDSAADRFLEAVLFAADAESLIDALWERLTGDGSLLARLLKSFAHSASVPDPQGALISAGGDAELITYMAATWRMPIWVLWPPVLRALSKHAKDAARLAPLEVATVAERWLTATPPQAPGRSEAAQLGYALAGCLADEGTERRYFEDDDKQKLWSAFLAAGAELPAEVTTMALSALLAGDAND